MFQVAGNSGAGVIQSACATPACSASASTSTSGSRCPTVGQVHRDQRREEARNAVEAAIKGSGPRPTSAAMSFYDADNDGDRRGPYYQFDGERDSPPEIQDGGRRGVRRHEGRTSIRASRPTCATRAGVAATDPIHRSFDTHERTAASRRSVHRFPGVARWHRCEAQAPASRGRTGPRDARHHQALPGRRRQRRHRPGGARRARSTRCSARTAPARRP